MNNQQMISDNFEEMYQNDHLPWKKHPPEPALERFFSFVKHTIDNPTLLDMGCGDGWISIMAAEHSFKVWGVDSSETAIEKAKLLAERERVEGKTTFIVSDALDLPFEKNSFDSMVDRGLFHHLLPKNRNVYFKNIKKVLKKESVVYLSVFSKKNSRGIGNRFTKNEIEKLFDDFDIIYYSEDPYPVSAPAHLLHFILQYKS